MFDQRQTGKTAGMTIRRLWTVEEANEALDWVGHRVERLRDLRTQLDSTEAVDASAVMATLPGGGYPGRRHAESTVRLLLGLTELEDEGVVVRDLQRGLVDFPAERNGEEVYLCWIAGEPEVSHWHGPEAGYLGRRPLD